MNRHDTAAPATGSTVTVESEYESYINVDAKVYSCTEYDDVLPRPQKDTQL